MIQRNEETKLRSLLLNLIFLSAVMSAVGGLKVGVSGVKQGEMILQTEHGELQ